jgi:hypothetical protein
LKIPVLITTTCTSWDYVIDGIAVHTACLACVPVTIKNALTNLAPLAGASIVLQCTAHQ